MSLQYWISRSGSRARHCRRAAAVALVVSLFASFMASSATLQVDPAFARANQEYNQGDYAAAVRGYRAILAQRGYSVPVLFDLGNAWWQLNQPGRAILNYERALQLAPGDQAVTLQLQKVQQQAGLPLTPPASVDHRLGLVGLDATAWLGIVALLTLSAAVLLARSRGSRTLPGLRTTAVLSAMVVLVSSAILIRSRPDLDRAVVVAEAAPVRVAPADAADVSFRLKPGSLVRSGARYDNFVMVHTDDGRSGWVGMQQVAKIVTQARDYGPLPANLFSGPTPASG